jgi:hypothetical protein
VTVYALTRYDMHCNGRVPSEGSPTGYRSCYKPYVPPAETSRYAKPAELRKLAAKDGWTHVRSALGRRFDFDYCPEHEVDAREAAARNGTRVRAARPAKAAGQ